MTTVETDILWRAREHGEHIIDLEVKEVGDLVLYKYVCKIQDLYTLDMVFLNPKGEVKRFCNNYNQEKQAKFFFNRFKLQMT